MPHHFHCYSLALSLFAVMPYFSPETGDSPQLNDCERADEDTTKNLDLKRVELEAPAETAIGPMITGEQPINVDVVPPNTSNPSKPAKCNATPEDDQENKPLSSRNSSGTRRSAMEKMSRIRFIWPTSCLTLKNMTANTSIKLVPDMDDEMQELLSNFIKHMRPEYQG